MDSNDQDKYNVQIVVKFPDIPKTDFVSYIYHFEVIGKQEYTFLQQFYPFHLEMKDQLEFPPYYSIDICGICKRQNYLKQVDQCLSGSRYCESDPDGPGPLKGADSLREIIRQLQMVEVCLKIRQLMFIECISPSCSFDIMTKVGIDAEEVKTCYAMSKVLSTGVKTKERILYLMNNWIFRGRTMYIIILIYKSTASDTREG
ncbi:unnamed protein product [Paramecium octaurelia]|uniref:Uncharacterized protein n=1 Tax=Paramecium octaurelia TaxID=43137 RepID=A0A8S1WHI2_PAROT|nr:unnamed protein product [Paramecium octaurelia]